MFGGRCRCNYLQILRKVEAAGIEPGHFDDLGAVSLRHLAPVRDSPREMGGPRALSRVANRHPAGSVDQRDHGGPEKVPISLKRWCDERDWHSLPPTVAQAAVRAACERGELEHDFPELVGLRRRTRSVPIQMQRGTTSVKLSVTPADGKVYDVS